MLSMNDLMDYCDLDRGEIEAVAEHEGIPLAVAIRSSARPCSSSPDGVFCLHGMIVENMQHALEEGHFEHVQELANTYQHLQRTHPLPL